ncbi:type II secretion system F family protein [Agromyces marinus]|uniref:Tight adherence protein B n=1 Tax=Agromyces marinus TaxID=1389020 RepID=A0ABN6YD44_9MICO|nr:type II secretion system F family protein [Agromyces marinus]UIP57922.1 hypothetical protein DSM26151_07900 [Agromyces marinus]BDZ53880.1 hypothetical protein GCM10025870_09530 [Agromyces marinus]
MLTRAVRAARRLLDRVLPRPADAAAPFDLVAGVAERLAALLTAGLAPATAWAALRTDAAEATRGSERDAAVLVAAADAAGSGESVAAAIESATRRAPHAARDRGAPPGEASSAWPVLAAAWAVADAAGAPLARTLVVLGSSLRDEAQLRREAAALLAGPRASARLVAALPVIAVAFGMMLGFDTLGVLLGGPLGLACLVAGSGLLWAGARWSRALVARAGVARPAPGLGLELLAVALSSGASVERAQEVVADALRRHVPELADRDASPPVLALAERAGAPVAELLRAEAARMRGAARSAGATRAAALGVRLMIPLGCCVLPAFVLLGVAPLMISVVTGTLGGSA